MKPMVKSAKLSEGGGMSQKHYGSSMKVNSGCKNGGEKRGFSKLNEVLG